MTETPWFPGHIKPVHFGVYKRRNVVGYITFSRWADCWCATGTSAKEAAKMTFASCWQDLEWRGLTEQPK